jgi:enolase-phosphatase E1
VAIDRLSSVGGVLLDVEGTTTPISFVHDVLFPYARARLREFLAENEAKPAVAEALRTLAAERSTDGGASHDIAAYAELLMDQDRKSPGLKALQGLIWERGYNAGALRGEVFDDVPPAFARWWNDGVKISIYSSGSVLAQRLLFGSTVYGDLTRMIASYFDTSVGPKKSAESYRRIAAALEMSPGQLLFVSDVGDELNAARTAGMQVAMCERPGNAPQRAKDVAVVRSFTEFEVTTMPG